MQVRNNILVALADWCMRYTGVVDAHVGSLAACLADPHALVRKQALALLACLLSKVCLHCIQPSGASAFQRGHAACLAGLQGGPLVRKQALALLTCLLIKRRTST